MIIRLLLLMAFHGCICTGWCQEVDRQKEQKKFRVSPLPVIYYSPETRLGYGALLAANFHTSKDTTTIGSYLQSSFIYTLNKQFEWSNIGRIYSHQNKGIFQYRIYYAYFPEFFFGYQTESPDDFKELVEYHRLWLEGRKYWRIKQYLYAGLYARLNKIYNLQPEDGGFLEQVQPPGYRGYTVAGISPALNFDSRNSQVYPSKGHFLEVLWIAHPDFMSDFTFGSFRVDARTYKAVKGLKDGVLAFQLFLTLNEGTVPFRDMADIGGPFVMRGYYNGYYRYKNYYAAQVELRLLITRLFGLAGWVGAALNSDVWYEPFQHTVRPNTGIGLRVRINQQDKLNLRADFGVGSNDQSGLYLNVSEAY